MPRVIVLQIGLVLLMSLAGPAVAQDTMGEMRDRDARIVEVADSETIIAMWSEPEFAGGAGAHYAISFDGGETFSEDRATTYELRLRYARFDPVAGAPAVAQHLAASADPEAAQMWIVQFITQPLEEYRRDIRAAGGRIYKYLGEHAYFVRMDQEALARIALLPYVRWIGPYHPAYKLDEELLAALVDEEIVLPRTRLNIQAFERGLADKQIVAARIAALSGAIDRMIPDGFLLEATLDEAQLLEVIRMPEVVWVDRWSAPELDMNNAREIGGANFVENETGFTGQGVRAEVMDTNLNDAHRDFQQRRPIFHGAHSGSTYHGTETFGINFGDGTGNSGARGMAPDAQGIFADFDHLQNRYAHTSELVKSPYFGVYQSNSWGDLRTTQYTNKSFEMDDIIFINDIIICQSQSNAGNQNSRPQAWAKNIVSVGGVRHNNTLTKTDDRWGSGGSTGPAQDGRVKPDLTHFYDGILTTDYRGAYTEGFGGTSGATPITAGHFAILFQMWSEGVFGNEHDPDGTVFDNRPHAMTAKAMMINFASPYNWLAGGANADLTRFRQGWGMADIGSMYAARDRIFIINESVALENLDTVSYDLVVEPDTPELRITMAYLDLPGVTASDRHRINDLSLRVRSPGGQIYWGNNGLINALWSTPGGTANEIDTVENVFVQNPQAGVWRIDVIASEVNEDARVETQEVDADFALVASGVIPPSKAFAALLDLQVVRGRLLAGDVDALRESDDSRVVAQSEFSFVVDEPNVVEMLLGFETAARPGEFDILFEGFIDHIDGINILQLRDWATGHLEEVARFAIGLSEEAIRTDGVDATAHIRADGRIELAVRQVVIATFALDGFRSLTDHVAIGVE